MDSVSPVFLDRFVGQGERLFYVDNISDDLFGKGSCSQENTADRV